MTKKLLTNKRAKWASQRQGVAFEGAATSYPASASAKYRASLEGLIAPMLRDYEREFAKVQPVTQDAAPITAANAALKSLGDKWRKRFAQQARTLTDRFIGRVDKHSKVTVSESLKQLSGGLTLKTPALSKPIYNALQAATVSNVALIKSIPTEFHAKLEKVVLNAFTGGGLGNKTILDEIRRLGTSTESRAEFIDVDQGRKITSTINAERMKAAGVKTFKWLHSSGGAEPRPLHVEYDGEVFSYDDPPVIDERTGERGLPGMLINCRCRAVPQIDFSSYLDE